MEELLEMSGGILDDQWLGIGEVAEVLTRNLELEDFAAMESFPGKRFLGILSSLILPIFMTNWNWMLL